MKPADGRYQTATQVKVLSPEITNVGRGRQSSFTGRQQKEYRIGETFFLPQGLRPWYGVEWKLQKLGRSNRFSEKVYLQTIRRGEEVEMTCWKSDYPIVV